MNANSDKMFNYFKNKHFSLKYLKNCKIINKGIELAEIKMGGSDAIFLSLIEKYKIFLKIIPISFFINVKINPNNYFMETKILQYLTKKYTLTQKTPHLILLYNYQYCKNLDLILEYLIFPTKCLSVEKQLTKKKLLPYTKSRFCNLLDKINDKIESNEFYVMYMEYCDGKLADLLDYWIKHLKKNKRLVDLICLNLDKIIFEVIFTLAIIQYDHPGFFHNDLFCRNIMLKYTNSKLTNHYYEYHYNNKIFYIPYNGVQIKIIDFGRTTIAGKITSNVAHLFTKLDKHYYINPFNKKTDIFNFLHDLYNGADLDTQSLYKLKTIYKVPDPIFKPIKNTIAKYLKVKTIDKINNANKDLLDSLWHIDSIKILENSVKTPHEYLISNVFDCFSRLPENATIIAVYNK